MAQTTFASTSPAVVRAVWFVAVHVLVLVFFCAPLASAAESRDQLAIRAAARQWIDAFKSGNLEQLISLYTANAVVALHGQPALRGRAAIREYFLPRVGRGQTQFLLDIEQIEIHGRTAHLLSAYWFTLTTDSSAAPYRDAGRSLLIYKKDRAGRWLIHVDIDQDTPDITFPPPPSAQ